MSTVVFQPRLSALPDETALTALTLPGTHDTMTAPCTHPYYRTQELTLAEQLDAGVRFLDLRLRHRPGQPLVAAHREWISTVTGAEILDTLAGFLADHPRETVLVRVQNANEDKDDFPAYGQALTELVSGYRDLFWSPAAADDGSCAWPSLGEVRGRVVAFECAPRELDLTVVDGWRWATHWHDNPGIALQDDWDGPTVEAKLTQVRRLYAEGPAGCLRLNHVSATNGELGNPLAYASRLNPATAALVRSVPGAGVLILDFATPDLIDTVWESNRLH